MRIYFGSDLLSMLLNSALILDLARLCELMKEFIALNFPALLNFNPCIRVNLLPICRLLFYSIQSHPAYTHPLNTDISVAKDSFFFSLENALAFSLTLSRLGPTSVNGDNGLFL